jgi:hypothetical protein
LHRLFLSVIAVAQLFGALLAFATLDAISKQTPAATLNRAQLVFLAVLVLVYLLGFLGSILIWVRRQAGLWLSLIHQILLVPIVLIPGVLFYVFGDALSFAVVASKAGDNLSFGFSFNIATTKVFTVARQTAGGSHYGVNLFALICALYLDRLRRSGGLANGDGGQPAPGGAGE